MRRILLTAFILFLSQTSWAEEIDSKYREILFSYAEAALNEFYYLSSSQKVPEFSFQEAHFIKGTDRIGRTFFVVMFSEDDGSIFVSLELNKDGLLEVHGRGGTHVTPKELESDFKNQIAHMIHYPGAT